MLKKTEFNLVFEIPGANVKIDCPNWQICNKHFLMLIFSVNLEYKIPSLWSPFLELFIERMENSDSIK